MFKPIPAPNGYDNEKYAVANESMPRCLAYTGRSTDEPLYDARCILEFLEERLCSEDGDDSAYGAWTDGKAERLRHGLRQIFRLAEDKVRLASGELALPPVASYGDKLAPKLWTPDKGADDDE